LSSLEQKFKGKVVCDMGCGSGIVGLYALKMGAQKVIQADINPFAVQNALENGRINGYGEKEVIIYKSDCFDNVPPQIFDVIVFNTPFHNDELEIKDPLKRAFYDPGFRSIKKFLSQIPDYSNSDTEVIIAFSNKGDIYLLEHLFDLFRYDWKLWKTANQQEKYDNRLYLLRL